ncbi:sensor histidine kinase [Streptomyces sp. NPDC050145]|uniref:sensor histidine kinase n=1 Tax=Streptomyces sp. NPDC050145 TaxID=3365602 RepID=UPI0037904B4C
MSVPAPPRPRATAKARRTSLGRPLAVLVAAAAAAGASAALAPSGATGWAVVTVAVAWAALAVAVLLGHTGGDRARRDARRAREELALTQGRLTQQSAETAQLVNLGLPAVLRRIEEGTEAAPGAQSPSDPQLRRILDEFTAALESMDRRARQVAAERDAARAELDRGTAELARMTQETFPTAVARLHDGVSADAVLAELDWPATPVLRVPAEAFLRELALSERRAAAAQAASAKALSRVQAKSVSMLADLRSMQERHGEEVFGDLLRLDHSTSQLGLMTDRLALLMGGRSSRAWNKPIVMESVLRGAVGRIAAYQRVRLHCATNAAIAGFAAEGVMHLLAELMDNAANFSPPIDEVHVYVEERSAGIVVTIEDSGLKMADAAMRRAEEAVSGQVTDLASLQGTRLGLAVVGRLALKYRIDVNFRPSSRGGTGVVVLLPPQLLAQRREAVRPAAMAPPAPAESAPAAAPVPGPASPPAPEETHERAEVPDPRPAPASGATPGGLPVRAPGRTMAAAEQERSRPAPSPGRAADPARSAGARFGAFHRGRKTAESGLHDGAPSAPDAPGRRPAGPTDDADRPDRPA